MALAPAQCTRVDVLGRTHQTSTLTVINWLSVNLVESNRRWIYHHMSL